MTKPLSEETVQHMGMVFVPVEEGELRHLRARLRMFETTVARMPAANPSRPRQEREPCDGEVSDALKKWAKRCNRTPRCSFKASYVIGGKRMCQGHAGKELLRLMLQERGGQ